MLKETDNVSEEEDLVFVSGVMDSQIKVSVPNETYSSVIDYLS